MTRRFTKAQRIEYRFLADAMRQLEFDIRHPVLLEPRLPREWHALTDVAHRRRMVSMRVDEDVLRFFRSLGPGYQRRMVLVLRAFMHARRAQMLEGPESIDYIADGIAEDEAGGARPRRGDTETEMREILGPVADPETGPQGRDD
jgi:uncharacterized protein (DUF4415 family)